MADSWHISELLTKDLMEIWPGQPYPLGATFNGSGVNFALFSEVAEKVELCLIADDGAETRVGLTEVDGHVWHAFIPTIQPGQRYGFRVHGDQHGPGELQHHSKLLLDPYAKAVAGSVRWHDSLLAASTTRSDGSSR